MSFLKFIFGERGKYPKQTVNRRSGLSKSAKERIKELGNLTPREVGELDQVIFSENVFDVNEKHKRRVAKWWSTLETQNQDSVLAMKKLKAAPHWVENLRMALLQEAMTHPDPKYNPELNYLYGRILTLIDNYNGEDKKFLDDEFDDKGNKFFKSLNWIKEEAKRIDIENEKERKALKYKADLANLFGIENVEFDKLCFETFKNKNKKEWHNILYKKITEIVGKEKADKIIMKFVKVNYGKNNEKRKVYEKARKEKREFKIMDEEFLSKINPEREVEKIGEIFEVGNEKFQIYELFTREQLKEESKALKHCVGEDDTYANKIRRGESRIFSLRDDNGKPKWTIEYDIVSKTILQLKGYEDEEPADKNSIIFICNYLTSLGIKVESIVLDDFQVFTKSGEIRLVKGVYSRLTDEKIFEFDKYLTEGFSNLQSNPIHIGQQYYEMVKFEQWVKLNPTLLDNEGLYIDLSWVEESYFLTQVTSIKSSVVESTSRNIYSDGIGWGITGRCSKEYRYDNLQEISGNLTYKVGIVEEITEGTRSFPKLTNIGGCLKIALGDQTYDSISKKNAINFLKFHFPELEYKGVKISTDNKIIEQMIRDGKLELILTI